MNANELKKSLLKASQSPLEELAREDIVRLYNLTQKTLEKLNRLLEQAESRKIHQKVRVEDKKLFEALLKKSPPEKRKTLAAVEEAARKSAELSTKYRPVIASLAKASPEEGLARLKSSTAEERETISMLAHVTGKDGRYLKIPAAKNARVEWLRGLHLRESGKFS